MGLPRGTEFIQGPPRLGLAEIGGPQDLETNLRSRLLMI